MIIIIIFLIKKKLLIYRFELSIKNKKNNIWLLKKKFKLVIFANIKNVFNKVKLFKAIIQLLKQIFIKIIYIMQNYFCKEDSLYN